MGWKNASAGICLCLVMVGTAGEIVRIASPLCDWHSTACQELIDSPVHLHMTDSSSFFASSSG